MIVCVSFKKVLCSCGDLSRCDFESSEYEDLACPSKIGSLCRSSNGGPHGDSSSHQSGTNLRHNVPSTTWGWCKGHILHWTQIRQIGTCHRRGLWTVQLGAETGRCYMSFLWCTGKSVEVLWRSTIVIYHILLWYIMIYLLWSLSLLRIDLFNRCQSPDATSSCCVCSRSKDGTLWNNLCTGAKHCIAGSCLSDKGVKTFKTLILLDTVQTMMRYIVTIIYIEIYIYSVYTICSPTAPLSNWSLTTRLAQGHFPLDYAAFAFHNTYPAWGRCITSFEGRVLRDT